MVRVLETSRLRIRSFTIDDLEAFARLMHLSFEGPSDAELYREQLSYYALAEKVLGQLRQPPYGDRAMVLKDTGRLIGAVGLVPSLGPFGQLPFFGAVEGSKFSPEVGLFYAVMPEHRGRGFAPEAAGAIARFAFDDLHLRRIVATTEYDKCRLRGGDAPDRHDGAAQPVADAAVVSGRWSVGSGGLMTGRGGGI